MALWRPTRRELIATVPLVIGASALPRAAWAQAQQSLRFFVLGDFGRKGGAFQNCVAEEMGRVADSFRPSFVLTTGDNFYKFGVTGDNDPHWRQSFDEIYTHPALSVPWYPVLGNHDWGGDVAAQVHRRDRRWRMGKLWYKLDARDHGHPDVAIYMIDTMIWGTSENWFFRLNGAKVPTSYEPLQEEWLRSELEQPGPPVKIVVGHHPVYSVGPHGPLSSKRVSKDLDALMKRTGVSLYVNGHDHCLYHIRQGDFHYVCSGGGSEMKGDYTGGGEPGCVLAGDCPDPSAPGEKPIWESFHQRAGFASFEIDRHAIRFAFHGPNKGEVIERSTIPTRKQTLYG